MGAIKNSRLLSIQVILWPIISSLLLDSVARSCAGRASTAILCVMQCLDIVER